MSDDGALESYDWVSVLERVLDLFREDQPASLPYQLRVGKRRRRGSGHTHCCLAAARLAMPLLQPLMRPEQAFMAASILVGVTCGPRAI